MSIIKPDQSYTDDHEHLTKDRIAKLLGQGLYYEVVNAAKRDKGVIRRLISSTYDKEDVLSWRAIETIGLIAGVLSRSGRIEVVRDTIRRLLWSMREESGGIGWSAAEMLGEIIRNSPNEHPDIIPIVWSFKDEEMFRAGVIWAMGRIATVRPDLINFISADLRPMLTDKNPIVKGYAAWVFGILGEKDTLEDIKNLSNDDSLIDFYQDGELIKSTVGEVAKEAINKLVAK